MASHPIHNARYSQQTTYPRNELTTHIVHLGFGAFHRGHQAVYNDLTNELTDERWGICEINMFGSSDLVDNLTAQDHLFTVIETSATETNSRLVRTVTEAIHTPETGIQTAIDKLLEPQIKIVSLTITEKGYCVNPQTRQLDTENSLIKHDLANPTQPQSAIGLIVEALKQRRALGLNGFSVMSCDNIPENGLLTGEAVLTFAKNIDSELATWIESNVTFPSTMVDRIVPAMTDEQYTLIESETDYKDPCGVVCEDFRQWVIEDNFIAGRPHWEAAGAMLVADVLPYEEMKLRMLNGSHSFLAYNGSLAGFEFIYQCMEDENFRTATLDLMVNEQAKSLSPELNVDLAEYAALLIKRFSNSNIKHKTLQIAMDGSQKLPQRAVDPYLTLVERNIMPKALPTLIAGWITFIITKVNAGREIFDPLAETFKQVVNQYTTAEEQAKALLELEQVFGAHGKHNTQLIDSVLTAFSVIEQNGIHVTIQKLANK